MASFFEPAAPAACTPYATRVLFDAIFLTLFFLTWLLLGALPWLVWSVRRRALGAIWGLPFALLGGAAGGVATPLLGLDNGVGIGVSMITAVIGGALLTAAAFWVWDGYALGDRFARWRVVQPPAPLPPANDPNALPDAGGDAQASIDSDARDPNALGVPRQPHDHDAEH